MLEHIQLSESLTQFIQVQLLAPLEWDELTLYTERWLAQRQGSNNDLFPIFICTAAGGRDEDAIPLAAYWTLSIAAARLLDDWHDGQEDKSLSPITASVLSTGLLGAAQAALSFLPPNSLGDVARNLGVTLSLVSKAQAQSSLTVDTDSYLRRVSSLTGLAWAALGWAAARIANTDTQVQGIAKDIGFNVGMVSAIADDMHDVQEDLANNVFTLPVTHALSCIKPSAQPMLIANLKACKCKQSIYQLLEKTSSMQYSFGLLSTYWEKSLELIAQLGGNTEDIEAYVQSLIRNS